MKACQELYALRVVEYGEENEYTIYAGITYAIYLRKTNRGSSEELGDPNHGLHHKGLGGGIKGTLTKLLARCMQILGSHHNCTKNVESELERFNL